MTFQSTTLRPGLLVSLKTVVEGDNVDYSRTILEAERITASGEQKARWETEKTVTDPKEHEAAIKVRGRCRSLIVGVCTKSEFGLLCPEDKIADLNIAIAEARTSADIFNRAASLSKVRINILAGRIAPTDVEAVRAINGEVRDLITQMETGLKNLDVGAVREAANRAKQLGSMLSPEAEERMQNTIDMVRKTARQIVKAGEAAAQEVDAATLARLVEARTAFLDLDAAQEVAAPAAEARAIDFEPLPERDLDEEQASFERNLEVDVPKIEL